MPVRSSVVTAPGSPLAHRLAVLDPGAVVHVPWPGADVDATRDLLARHDGATSLVYVSSATVYGAWADNPVPLTEDAPLRPNPIVGDAIRHAEAERLVAQWADDHPRARVTVLRPASMLGPGVDSWLAHTPRLRSTRADPARQFVHVDDVAAAVHLALREGLDGVFNVAADGSIASEVVRGLSAGRVSIPVPDVVARWTSALGLSGVPSELGPLAEHPWVVANDRLRAAGWAPQYTNEEAIVAGRPGSWWREMSPGRRQQVTLGASVALIGGAVAGAAAVVVARRRVS